MVFIPSNRKWIIEEKGEKIELNRKVLGRDEFWAMNHPEAIQKGSCSLKNKIRFALPILIEVPIPYGKAFFLELFVRIPCLTTNRQ